MSTIKIHRAILHILDTNIETPVLSDREIELSEEIEEYISLHIEKLMDDSDIKMCTFNKISPFKDVIFSFKDHNFVELSKKLSEKLFSIMLSNIDIPPADIIFCIFSFGQTRFLGILKLNYKISYIHNLNMDNGLKNTKIIKQRTTIANEKQKVDECIFINLDDYSISLKEKKYSIDGHKIYYLSQLYLHASTKLSTKQQYNIVQKTAEKVVEEYYDNDIKKHAIVKEAIEKNTNDEMELDINQASTEMFKNNTALREQYSQELKKQGVEEEKITINEQIKKKITSSQKIITDEGIELRIPAQYLNDSQKVEFVMNEDGTISIIIKSIKQMDKK